MRQALQQQFDVNPTTVYRLTNMPMGEKFLKQIGEVISTHPNRNGLYAIRSALILAAADSEGLNAINVMRHFPTQEIQVNTNLIFSLMKETANFLSYNKTTIAAIAQEANQEIVSQKNLNFGQLPDLRKPGTQSVKKKTVTFGATLNQERIRQVCQQNRPTLNASMLLQCRASYLPPAEYNLQDPRIKAVVAVNPVTSSVLGPEGLKEIAIPTMIWGGSKDITTPFIEEQAHPFLWLKTQHKYLGVVVGGTHSLDLGKSYLKAMSLAFFEVYLRDRQNARSYLTNAYSQTISTEELPLHLIKSLTPAQLEQAYGNTPPTPPIPESLVAISPSQRENTLAEIKKTRTLKIGMRTDAAPFGYIDAKQDLWTGFCADFADSLGQHLAQKLNIPSGIEIIKLPSSLENRFELVEQDTVHLECGPNSISKEREDISFSNPFFVSGTRFLVTNGNVAQVNLTRGLEGVGIGVLQDTTNAQFIQETYPEAEVVYFQGETGRS